MPASSAPGESLSPQRNTAGTASGVRRDVVSEVHRDLVNTKTMVSDLHHNMLKSQEGASGKSQPVSFAGTLSPTITLTYCCLDSKQVRNLNH